MIIAPSEPWVNHVPHLQLRTVGSSKYHPLLIELLLVSKDAMSPAWEI